MCAFTIEALLDSRLSDRLRTTYRLADSPKSPREFAEMWRARIEANPRSRDYLRLVRDGDAVIGETKAKRGQSIVLPDGREASVMCGYDALMTAVLRGRGIVRATCFHCGEPVEVHILGDRVVRATPETAVFWLGDGPEGIPICDHLNLFPSLDHLSAWREQMTEELGIPLSIEAATELLVQIKQGL